MRKINFLSLDLWAGIVIGAVATIIAGAFLLVVVALNTYRSGVPVKENEPIAAVSPGIEGEVIVNNCSTILSKPNTYFYMGKYIPVTVDNEFKSCMGVKLPGDGSGLYVNLGMCWPP